MLPRPSLWTRERAQGKLGTRVDFLLECIGFPPDHPLEELVDRVLTAGEPAPWRGDARDHRRLALGSGLELRMDRSAASRPWNLLPHYQPMRRLRVSVDDLRPLPDSPFDVLLQAWVAPPVDPAERRLRKGAYRLGVNLVDARKLPNAIDYGHVLAVQAAGFALDIASIHPRADATHEPWVRPLSGENDPGGCADLSLGIRGISRFTNPITGLEIQALELDAPEFPLTVFLSPWELERNGLEAPRAGGTITGSFLFLGTIAAGIGQPARSVGRNFG